MMKPTLVVAGAAGVALVVSLLRAAKKHGLQPEKITHFEYLFSVETLKYAVDSGRCTPAVIPKAPRAFCAMMMYIHARAA